MTKFQTNENQEFQKMVALLDGGLSYRMGLQKLMEVWDTSAGEHIVRQQQSDIEAALIEEGRVAERTQAQLSDPEAALIEERRATEGPQHMRNVWQTQHLQASLLEQ